MMHFDLPLPKRVNMRKSLARLVSLWCVAGLVSGVGLQWTAADEPDYTQTDSKEWGVTPVSPKPDPTTGFIVGGSNSTQSLKTLTEINGRSIADLEHDMRPDADSDVASTAGFLGPNESLLAVLAADNAYVVDKQRLTHAQIARHLRVLAAIGEKHPGQEFVYHGSRFQVTVRFSRGYQESPFRDGTKSNRDVTVKNLTTGQRLEYSLLVPAMIERYGFYEGEGTPYRVVPKRIVAVLDFLAR